MGITKLVNIYALCFTIYMTKEKAIKQIRIYSREWEKLRKVAFDNKISLAEALALILNPKK